MQISKTAAETMRARVCGKNEKEFYTKLRIKLNTLWEWASGNYLALSALNSFIPGDERRRKSISRVNGAREMQLQTDKKSN